MLDLMLFVILAVIAFAVIIAFKIFANLVKAVLAVSAVLFVVSAVVGGIVVKDAIDLKKDLQARSNLQLLVNRDGTKILTGLVNVQGDAEGAAAAGSAVRALSGIEVEALNQQYSRQDYDAMLGSNYKLIIFNEASLAQSLPQTINQSGREIPSELILQQLESGDAESRALAFSLLLSLKVSHDMSYIISNYRNGSVIIYPETPSLKVIKIIPRSLLASVAGIAQPAGA